jgi:hypothetical protein
MMCGRVVGWRLVRWGQVHVSAEIEGCSVQGEVVKCSPKVQLIAAPPARETMVDVALQMNREAVGEP